MNKYENISIKRALELIKKETLILPDIQREYVWDYGDIESLFDSVVRDYPIGTCIFWKTNKKVLNKEKPNLYKFINNFVSFNTKNEKLPEFFDEEDDYFIVLDGQQRITSFNIGLKGEYKYFKGGRGHLKSNPKSWLTKKLYYNLAYQNKDNEEGEIKRFVFLTEEEYLAQTNNFYKVSEICKYSKKEADELKKDLKDRGYSEQAQNDIFKLYSRIIDDSENSLIHYYCISENTYDEALDIFVKVNSTGKKLSKSDLIYSTLINGGVKKEEVENLLKAVNGKDEFNFTRDYLMRLCLVLVDADTQLKIQSLTNEKIKQIKDSWERISKAFTQLRDVLSRIGMYGEFLSSYNATMPVAYYLYKGGEITDDVNMEIRKFLAIAMCKRLFGVAGNDVLKKCRQALSNKQYPKTKFSVELFKGIVLTGNRTFTVTEEDIEGWFEKEKGQDTYIVLTLLYPNVKLDKYCFHQDHCHPYALFENKAISKYNISSDTLTKWKRQRNLLPNLQLLEGRENERKNKKPLEEWLRESGNKIEYCSANCSYKIEDFEIFFTEREMEMKKQLKKVFGI